MEIVYVIENGQILPIWVSEWSECVCVDVCETVISILHTNAYLFIIYLLDRF